MYKPRLMAPGPVEVPPQVLEALARPIIHHRTEVFKEIFLRARAKLAKLTLVPDDVLILTSSGTAGFEAALLATVPRGGKVLGINAGKFGERWVKLAERYGYEVVSMELEWGKAVDPDELINLLSQHPDIAALLTTHSETSTGVLHDVEQIAKVARELVPEALILVDCVTSLGAAELRPLEWGLDAVVSGSQKGVMTPPGLAFVWLSERAWAKSDKLNPTFYLDLHQELRQQRQGQTTYTPAVSLVAGLDAALDLLLEEGIENVWARRDRLNRTIITAAESLACAPYAERASPAVAALRAPEGLKAPAIVRGFGKRGMRIAGGQDRAKPVLFRPSVLGYADAYDALTIVAVLEDVLRELGQNIPYGQAVAVAMQVLAET